MTTELDQLAMSLASAQAQFPVVSKSGKNPHLKNEYATLDDIICAIRKPLAEHGLSFVQLLGSNDAGFTLRTILLHSSGQSLESTVVVDPGEGNRGVNALQSLGSAITYMKRYALGAMLGIATDGDTDGEGAPPSSGTRPVPQTTAQSHAGRPLDGPSIRDTIRKKAGWQGDLRAEGEPITQGQVKGVAGLLADTVKHIPGMNQAMIDKNRHDVLGYLVGVNETLRLTKREASAIIAWLKEDGEGWDLNGYAVQEVQNVLKALGAEAGQQQMEL